MRRRFILLLVLVILAAALALGYFLGTPTVLALSPEPGAASVPAGSALRLTFSRPMNLDSVLERLEIEPGVPGDYRMDGSTLIFTPHQAWPGGATVQVSLEAGAQAAGWLSLPLRTAESWSFTVSRPRLAYLFPVEGPANVYLIDPVSGQVARLTNSRAGVLEYHINSTGTALYYSVDNPQGGSNLYRQDGVETVWNLGEPDADGVLVADLPDPVLVMECPQAACRFPQVSPQGDYLAYEMTGLPGSDLPNYPQVWLLPLPQNVAGGGGEPAVPVLAAAEGHQTIQPEWSPDGRLTFYNTDLSAFVTLDPKSGETIEFPNDVGQPGTWSPDGQTYVAPHFYVIEPPLPELDPVYTLRLASYSGEGSEPEYLTPDESLEDTSPAFSPDGSRLVFARQYLDSARWTPGSQLWLLPLDQGEPGPLTNDPYFNHFAFAWSPDSRHLAFVRFNETVLSEPPELWMIDTESTIAQQLMIGGYSPQWTP